MDTFIRRCAYFLSKHKDIIINILGILSLRKELTGPSTYKAIDFKFYFHQMVGKFSEVFFFFLLLQFFLITLYR
jgi:hypothetical protein